MALDGRRLSRNPPTVALIVATAFTRAAAAAMAAEPDDAAALLLPLLLLGASDRADDDADATQPMAILFPRPRRGRPNWTSNDGNGRRLNEEGKEAGTRTRGLCAAAVLQLQQQQVWVLLLGDGLMSRAMARRCLYRLARGTVRRGLSRSFELCVCACS